jgi:restriction endonuclease S subunit
MEIADIQMGYQTRKRITVSESGRISIIMGKDIGPDNLIYLDKLDRIEPEGDYTRYLLQKGDVLFTAKGSNNFAACITSDLADTVASGSFYILRIKSRSALEPCYLAWWLNQATAQEHFRQTQSSGATISYISAEALRKTPVNIPPLKIQESIIRLSDLHKAWKRKTLELCKLQENLITFSTNKAITKKEKA